MKKCFFKTLLCFLLSMCPEAGLLRHRAILVLIAWRNGRTAIPIPTSRVRGARSSSAVLPCHVVAAGSVGVRGSLHVVLICISLVVTGAEHICVCLRWTFAYILWKYVYFSPFPVFEVGRSVVVVVVDEF